MSSVKLRGCISEYRASPFKINLKNKRGSLIFPFPHLPLKKQKQAPVLLNQLRPFDLECNLPVLHINVEKVKQPRKVATMTTKINLAYLSDEMLQKRGKSCRGS